MALSVCDTQLNQPTFSYFIIICPKRRNVFNMLRREWGGNPEIESRNHSLFREKYTCIHFYAELMKIELKIEILALLIENKLNFPQLIKYV